MSGLALVTNIDGFISSNFVGMWVHECFLPSCLESPVGKQEIDNDDSILFNLPVEAF